jgi:D-serine deaminase-like pyridoxal phosphate-dependent protein
VIGIDADAVAALGRIMLDWRYKAIPADAWDTTVAEYVAGKPALRSFGTPLLTLDEAALAHNLVAMADWCAGAGVDLAPHGKTTMAPALWQRQLVHGACAITVANLPQLRVAHAFGVTRIIFGGSLLDPAGLRWVAAQPGLNPLSWVDSERSVELMDGALRDWMGWRGPGGHGGAQRALDVCVELGASGARTGCRDADAALAVARAVRAAPTLRLAGVAGYEGAIAHDAAPASLAAVDEYLRRLAGLHEQLAAGELYETPEVVVTAGGSAFFDRVAEILAPLADARTRVVLRAGSYLVHDDGFYRGITPSSRGAGPRLRSAMHAWARVVSRPEPALALLDAGRRDVPFDQGMPIPQGIAGARVVALNDQHAFLALPAEGGPQVGDVVRLGLSHPCTALDKWTLIPVLDDVDSAEPVVVSLVRTFF